MRDETSEDDAGALERKLAALAEAPIPEDLLGRCLASIPDPARSAPNRPSRTVEWSLRFAAAALLLIGIGALLGRPRHADAASLLKAVRAAWTAVPAAHLVVRHMGTRGTKTEEAWFVRDKGRRREFRSGNELTLVVVDNRRWQFRWDVREHSVAAWSAEIAGDDSPSEDTGLVLDSTEFLRWAESQAAAIRTESVRLAGRDARKVVLHWPGPTAGTSVPREQVVWFDPTSLLPLKQRLTYGDGNIAETTFDFPARTAVPDDLFAFRPQPDLTLEINDPDLGRQVVIERRSGAGDPVPPGSKGGVR